jgi:hypothetical protein
MIAIGYVQIQLFFKNIVKQHLTLRSVSSLNIPSNIKIVIIFAKNIALSSVKTQQSYGKDYFHSSL